MAWYRQIHMTFWTDSKISDEFTPEDKYFFLYLLTNPYTNLCGCYEITQRQMSIDTGYSAETVDRLLDRMENVHKVIRYSKDTHELLILNWYKYNWNKSEKVLKGALRDSKKIKNQDFRKKIEDLVIGF